MGPIGKLNPIWFRNCNENCQYFGGVFWSILVPFLVYFEVILVHFWVMLGLWGPFWGPLTPLGAILGSTSKNEPIFEQIRENGADHFGTILALCCVCWCLFGQLLWGPIFSSILGRLLEGSMWPK